MSRSDPFPLIIGLFTIPLVFLAYDYFIASVVTWTLLGIALLIFLPGCMQES